MSPPSVLDPRGRRPPAPAGSTPMIMSIFLPPKEVCVHQIAAQTIGFFILFYVKKQRSDSTVVIGVVNTIFKSLIVSENAACLSSSEDKKQNKSNSLLLLHKSCLEYKSMSSLLSFPWSSIG